VRVRACMCFWGYRSGESPRARAFGSLIDRSVDRPPMPSTTATPHRRTHLKVGPTVKSATPNRIKPTQTATAAQ
jgi:hypothetical protein